MTKKFRFIIAFLISFSYGTQQLQAEEEPITLPFLTPVSLNRCGEVTFKPGFRVQVRYLYDDGDHNHDIFIRRFRLKGSGNVFGIAKYGSELKIDNTGRFCKDPKAKVENAWVDFTLCKKLVYLRAGLYDLPFSRNALTSDSKLLLMDRSLVKGALTDLGLADNTIGFMLHGRPWHGHLEYAVGIFDNEKFEKIGPLGTKRSDQLMPAGRIVYNLLDPATPSDGYADYRGSYICKGRRLALGFNAAYLGSAKDKDKKFDIYGVGTDLFFNQGRFTFQAEIDWFKEAMKKGDRDIEGYGWYVQAGYLFSCVWEIAARYQELEPDVHSSNNKERWATLGVNTYIREHYLKVQTEYTYRDDQEDHNNVFQLQLQFDY